MDSPTIQSSNPTRDVPIDVLIDSMVRPITDAVSGFIFYAVPVGDANLPLIVAWLVAGGLFFTEQISKSFEAVIAPRKHG